MAAWSHDHACMTHGCTLFCSYAKNNTHTCTLESFTGLVVFILLSLLPPTRLLLDKVRTTFAQTVESKRWIAFVMGGAILGMGMTVSGAVSSLRKYVDVSHFGSAQTLPV